MPHSTFSMPKTNELRKDGEVVGSTGRVYEISGDQVMFDEVLVRGDLSGDLDYNGAKLRIVSIDTMVGLEVGVQGARGPVWRGVTCQVLSNG